MRLLLHHEERRSNRQQECDEGKGEDSLQVPARFRRIIMLRRCV
nr:MAG TPA: hypothetical protein [Caudoviricetes sp.]